MEALSFRNNYIKNQPEEVKKRLQSQENFTSLDADKLKQDTVEIASKAGESIQDSVKENWFYKQLRHFGVKDPKKLIKSVTFAIATTVGLAILGNKMSNKTAELGQTIGDDIIAKTAPYKWLQNCGNRIKTSLLKSINNNKYTKEIYTTFTQRFEHAKLDIARGYGQGFLGIFSLTPVEIMQKSLAKMGISADNIDDAVKVLNQKLKIEDKTARKLAEQLLGTAKDKMTRKEICQMLTQGISDGFGCKNKKELLALFKDMQTNPEFADFYNIKMSDKGLGSILGSWWPANIINTITMGKFQRHLTGNLGDSLVKYNVVNGTMAETKIGSLMQKAVTIPTESISNFVNDKSGAGALISAGCLVPLYNNVQDAPKKKKIPTILNDFVGGIGTFALSMPIANKLVYGHATMANFDTKDKILLKPFQFIGRFFDAGLKDTAVTKTGFLGLLQKTGGKIKGFLGGGMRGYLIMLAISPIVGKVIHNIVAKIFGKPYDPAEEAKQKQLEEQKNTVIPELGITQGELQEKILKNPQAIEKMQKDPELVKVIDKNPKLMLDLLDGKEIDTKEILAKAQSKAQSPMLQNMIKTEKSDISNQADLFGKNKKKEQEITPQIPKDSATYIPSSTFVAQPQKMSDAALNQYQNLMSKADKVLSEAEKYI